MDRTEIESQRAKWESTILKPTLARFDLKECPNRFYTPADVGDFDFLQKVGFPGQYPFTAGTYPTKVHQYARGWGVTNAIGKAIRRAGRYSGYGLANDTRDYYKHMQSLGQLGGPNIAFDLPTQIGYDSDNPIARGEVGRAGVAVDSLKDFEIIYEAFTGPNDLDKIQSNWTINAPCIIVLAMYIALAKQRHIPIERLRATPQNDILKEFASRGTYIFPPRPSMRLTRDIIVYCADHMPQTNTISICAEHMREGGAHGVMDLAFGLCNAIQYLQLGVDAGLDIDQFAQRFTYRGFGGGTLNIFFGVARARAARRIFAKVMRERFRSKNPRTWILRGGEQAWFTKDMFTVQRPLNNLTRGVIDGIIAALAGGEPMVVPWDEPLGLGHSLEAQQLSIDAIRILELEAGLFDVTDPLAGSYYVESLTDKVAQEILRIMEQVKSIGGAVSAIEKGFYQQQIASGAYELYRELEMGKRKWIGVNCFTGESELEVIPGRLVPHPYDTQRREECEEKQVSRLKRIKKARDNTSVLATLRRLEEASRDENVNLVPPVLEAVEAYATVGEICDVFRQAFGAWEAWGFK
jgi:methylmalonyl-CoA mutase N-terminal domain/subunit